MLHPRTQPCNEGLSCGGHPTRPSRGAHRPSPQRNRYRHLKRWIQRQYRLRLLQLRMPWCGAPRLNWDRCARRSAAPPPRVPSAGLRRQQYRPAAAARDLRLQRWQLQPQLQQQSPPEQHQYSGRNGGGEDGLCAKAARGLRSPASFGTYKRRQL